MDKKTEKLLLYLSELSKQIAQGKYSREDDIFELTKKEQYPGVVNELAESFGMMMVRVEAREYYLGELVNELKESIDKTNRTLKGVIFALASAIEKRDLYTAGHQLRVSKLACAIASEMNLSEDTIEGIRVGAVLHDIGKIYIPAEILTKPAKLTDIELALIKTHTQAGYEILKNIEFPWPVAETALQHHERIDGSGYPKGISGDDIILEAKIVAVADVVEGMASHRPYRPALGVERALQEITSYSGKFFEPDVVNICKRVLDKKKFTMDG